MSKVFEIKNNSSDRSYYCSIKFKFLKIDLESHTTYNCHAATPHTISTDWLKNNPGQLFNYDINVEERDMMLRNQRNPSCEQNCWAAEDRNAISPRIVQGGTELTHLTSRTQPEVIDLTISKDCNLTCSYCCKEYSSAWRRDILKNGDYSISTPRYSATLKDRILLNISQKELKNTLGYQQMLNEVILASPGLKRLVITGGEPLLDNQLINTLKQLNLTSQTQIEIYTGLGISMSRFDRLIEELKLIKNLVMIVSAESIGRFLEFNRYGSKWDEFKLKIEQLEQNQINMRLQSTITNLTIFGFADFYQYFKNHELVLNFAYQPTMMSPYVLDTQSKEYICEQMQMLPDKIKNPILQSIDASPTDTDRTNIGIFLKEFVSRRPDLDLSIFPKHFLQWTEHVV